VVVTQTAAGCCYTAAAAVLLRVSPRATTSIASITVLTSHDAVAGSIMILSLPRDAGWVDYEDAGRTRVAHLHKPEAMDFPSKK